MLADYLVLIEKAVDADRIGRWSLSKIQYWADRAFAIAQRRSRGQ